MDIIERFVSAEGKYLGRGVNHEDGNFEGELRVQPAVEGAGVFLHFEARGDEDNPLHEEHMLIGKTRLGETFLWGLDSGSERIRKHAVREASEAEGRETIRFGVGDPDDIDVLREEITFVFSGRDITLKYAWGGPGEGFEERSAVELVPQNYYSLAAESHSETVVYREFEERPSDEILSSVGSVYDRIFGPDERSGLRDPETWQQMQRPHLAVAEVEGTAVGFKLGYQRRPGRFYSWLGGVVPEFRGRNIATELLCRQHRWARRAGFDSVRTKTTNQWRGMLILNLEQGFDVIGTHRDGRGETKVMLEKDLTDED